jgi:hypothetical protein
MATSGTATFNLQFDDIIEEAFERCGLEVRTGYDIRTASRSLNLMFAEWANRGLNLWTIEQRQQVLDPGDPQYSLPSDTVDVLSAVLRTGSGTNQQDITLDRISQNEYLHLPNKLQTGTAELFIYPAPDTSQVYTFRYYGIRRIQDVGAATNTADISFRFLPALIAGLAYYIAIKRAPERIGTLKNFYEEEFFRAAAEDRDRASVFLTPDVQSY